LLTVPGEYEEHCTYYEPWMLALMCGTIIVPYNTLLMYLSSCSCIHGKAFFHYHIVGKSCKKCLEAFGGKLMIFVIGMSVQCYVQCAVCYMLCAMCFCYD
jgi:hypothetical protein